MSAISLKSITGITSITTPAGVDDQLTLHTNDTTQRVKVTQSGIEAVGVATFQDLDVDGHTNLDNVSIAGITTVNGGFIFDNGTNAGKDLQWQPSNNRLAFFNDVKATFGNTVDLQLYHSSNENHIYGSTNKPIIFSTNTTERLKITSTGLMYVNRDGVGGRIDATAGNASMTFSDGNGRQTFKITTMASGQSAAHSFDANGDLNLNTTTNQYGYRLNIQDSAIIYAQTASSGGLEAKWHLDNSAQLMELGTVTTDDLALVTTNVPRLQIKSDGRIHVFGSRAGSLQANDDDTLQLYTKSTNNSIDRGTGITFYNHDNSGYEMGGTIQVAKENGTVNDAKGYMRFCTNTGSTTTEKLRIDSSGRVLINRTQQHVSSSEKLSVNGMTSIQYNSTTAACLYLFNEETTTSGHPIQPYIYFHDGSGIRSGFGVQRSTGKTILGGHFGLSLRTGASGVNGTERLFVKSTGEVQIGSNEGGYRLNVTRESSDTTTAETQLLLYAKHDGSGNTGVGYGGGIRFWGDRNGDNVEQNMGRIMCIADVNSGTNISGALSFETGTAGVLGEKLRIASDGKVRIGEGTPQLALLHISPTLYGINLQNDSNNKSRILFSKNSAGNDSRTWIEGNGELNGYIALAAGDNERLRIDGAGTALFANGIQIGVDEGSSTSGGLLIHRYSNTSINDGVDFDLTITFPHSNIGGYMIECFSGHSHYRGSIMYYKVVGMYGASTASGGGVDLTAIQEVNTNSISFSDTSNATQRTNGDNYSITITARSALSNVGTSLKSHIHVYVHSRVAPVSVTIS